MSDPDPEAVRSRAENSVGVKGRRQGWTGFLTHHATALWWLHSGWSLLWGLGFLWLGSRSFATLRVAVFYLAFIWTSGLLLPWLERAPFLGPANRERRRLLVNYLHRNFSQQLLFFVLPVYWRSATVRSPHGVWLALLGFCAVLATLDVVYDQALSRHWFFLSTFFAFTLFAVVNVMVPVLFHLPSLVALGIASLISFAGFASFCWGHSPHPPGRNRQAMLGAAAVLLGLVFLGRGWIPPAPLTLASAEFGGAVDPATLRVVGTLDEARAQRRLAVMTAIRAPMGLADRVRHRWLVNGRVWFVSFPRRVEGGRREGFRLWSGVALPDRFGPGDRLRVRVETAAGQLIGIAELPVRKGSSGRDPA